MGCVKRLDDLRERKLTRTIGKVFPCMLELKQKIIRGRGRKIIFRILFVCHGNICRSPMAEFIMKHLVQQAGLEDQFVISSAATSTEELGNDMYPNAKAELKLHKIPFKKRQARQIKSSDYEDWDFIIAMDQANLSNIRYVIGHDPKKKVRLLMSFTDAGENRSISDPWYTRDFAKAFNDIKLGCEALLDYYLKERSS